MSSSVVTRFTEVEYLALERVSDRKHEFVDGAIVARAGACPPHNVLAANVTTALGLLSRAKGGVTMTSDQRVHVPKTGLYTYPDVTVACGERRYGADHPPSLLNPTVLVEVTSDSTEDFDRGKKFLHYQGIAELRAYLIVSHTEQRIDCFRRLDDGWHLQAATDASGSVDLPALGGRLTIEDVYAGVDLDEGRHA